MRIYRDENLRNFEFWAGARNTALYLTDNEFNMIEDLLTDAYPQGMSETEVNDIFWFDEDWIAEMLGYENFEHLIYERNQG